MTDQTRPSATASDAASAIEPTSTTLRAKIIDVLFARLYPGQTRTMLETAVDDLFAEGLVSEPTLVEQWGNWPTGHVTPEICPDEASARAAVADDRRRCIDTTLVRRTFPHGVDPSTEATYTGWSVVTS